MWRSQIDTLAKMIHKRWNISNSNKSSSTHNMKVIFQLILLKESHTKKNPTVPHRPIIVKNRFQTRFRMHEGKRWCWRSGIRRLGRQQKMMMNMMPRYPGLAQGSITHGAGKKAQNKAVAYGSGYQTFRYMKILWAFHNRGTVVAHFQIPILVKLGVCPTNWAPL